MELNFDKLGGLVPAIVQDAKTSVVLMLGFMNKEALAQTEKAGRVTFFSRSKNRLWTKGETSGNFLNVVQIIVDCDQDTLLIKANPVGPACHTGADTCFQEENKAGFSFLTELQDLLEDRKANPPAGSYTASLFSEGIKRMAQKVGEEGVEVALEALGDQDDKLVSEAADLLFHLQVLLIAKGHRLETVISELQSRHQSS